MLLSVATVISTDDSIHGEKLQVYCVPYVYQYTWTHSPVLSFQLPACSWPYLAHTKTFILSQPHTHTHTNTITHHFLTLNLTLVWWGPCLGSLRVLMANGADIVMSDQSSCSPSQQHISHSYKFSPLAQAEDLDAYLMFIFYRSHLSRPVCEAKSLKRWQSPYIACSYLTESNKCVLHPRKWCSFFNEDPGNAASVNNNGMIIVISWSHFTINTRAWKRGITSIKQEPKTK